MSNMALIESSSLRVGRLDEGGVEPGMLGSLRRSGIRVGSLGSGLGFRLRSSSSRRRRMISSGSGSPSGPVFRVVPEVGIGLSLGNVLGVVPLGVGFLITLIVGNC